MVTRCEKTGFQYYGGGKYWNTILAPLIYSDFEEDGGGSLNSANY